MFQRLNEIIFPDIWVLNIVDLIKKELLEYRIIPDCQDSQTEEGSIIIFYKNHSICFEVTLDHNILYINNGDCKKIVIRSSDKFNDIKEAIRNLAIK